MGSVSTPEWSPMSSSATLRARHQCREDTWVLELSGEADMATWGLVRMVGAQMATVTDRCIVVDVGNLDFCDVTSAHLIMGTRQDIPVSVSGATGSVRRVWIPDPPVRIAGARTPRSRPAGARPFRRGGR